MKRAIIVLLAWFFVIPLSHAGETPTEHMFTTKVAAVRLSGHLLAQGKSMEESVSVKVPAIIFKNPLYIKDVRQAGKHPHPEVDKIIQYYKTNIEGDAASILSFWLPGERQEKGELVNDPEILAQTKKHFAQRPYLTIIGIIFQKETSSVLIKRHTNVRGISLRKAGTDYYLTDIPTDDLELAIIEASLIQELRPTKK